MPRLNAGLADIETNQKPIDAGAHTGKIKNVEVKKSKSGLDMVVVESEITEGEFTGRTLMDWIVLVKKDGAPNETGLRQLKKLAIATVGEERAVDEEFDTDEMIGQPVELIVKQEDYEDDDTGDTIVSARVKKYVAVR